MKRLVVPLVLMVLLGGALFITVYYAQRQQEIRSRAVNDQEFMLVTQAQRRRGKKTQVNVVLNNLDPKFRYRLNLTLSYNQNTADGSLPATEKPSDRKKKRSVHENKTYKFRFRTPSCDWKAALDIQLSYREKHKKDWLPVNAPTAKGNTSLEYTCRATPEEDERDDEGLAEADSESQDLEEFSDESSPDPEVAEDEAASAESPTPTHASPAGDNPSGQSPTPTATVGTPTHVQDVTPTPTASPTVTPTPTSSVSAPTPTATVGTPTSPAITPTPTPTSAAGQHTSSEQRGDGDLAQAIQTPTPSPTATPANQGLVIVTPTPTPSPRFLGGWNAVWPFGRTTPTATPTPTVNPGLAFVSAPETGVSVPEEQSDVYNQDIRVNAGEPSQPVVPGVFPSVQTANAGNRGSSGTQGLSRMLLWGIGGAGGLVLGAVGIALLRRKHAKPPPGPVLMNEPIRPPDLPDGGPPQTSV